MRKLFCTASIPLKSIYRFIFESVSNFSVVLAYCSIKYLEFNWTQVGQTVELLDRRKKIMSG